jgi:hypothetical protein
MRFRMGYSRSPTAQSLPACLELRLVGRKQQDLWPYPIFRGRATQERGSIDSQGLKKYASTSDWGLGQFNDGKPVDVASPQHLHLLPPDRPSSRPCFSRYAS